MSAHQGRVVLQRRVHAPQGGHPGRHRQLAPLTAAAQGLLYPFQPGLHGNGLQRHALRRSLESPLQARFKAAVHMDA